MEELLPYYERELSYLRRYSEDFAQRHPKIAGRLLQVGEQSDDPYIEQMIQGIALLDALIAKKLAGDYPNSIVPLILVSKHTGEEIVRCQPHSSGFVLA